MRTVVLVFNYIIVGIMALGILGLSTQTEAEAASTIVGFVILAPVVVVNLVYAHSQREK